MDNNLIKTEIVDNYPIVKISSRIIAEETNKNHADILRDIRNLIEKLGQSKYADSSYTFELSEYNNSQGKKQPEYLLTKKEALLLISGYNPVLRAKIIDRLEELEKQLQPKMPTHIEALRLYADELEKNQLLLQQNNQQATQIKEMQPKVDIYEKFLECKNAISMSQYTAILSSNGFDIGRNRIFKYLKDDKLLQSNNTPYQKYRDMELFEVIMVETEAGWKPKTLITSKGMKYVYDLLIKKFKRYRTLY